MSKGILFKNKNNEPIYPCPYFPVGSIFLSVNNVNPGTIFGGTWEQIKDRFLLGAGSTYTAGATGGSATHKLTVSEMPSHTHTHTEFSLSCWSIIWKPRWWWKYMCSFNYI